MNPDTNRFEPLREAPEEAPLNRKMRRAQSAHERLLAAQERRAQAVRDRHAKEPRLLRPDGSEVPEHWSVFTVGERVVVKNYTFKVAHIGESHLLLEPAGPVLVGEVQDG
jgi:hypothetical protein